MPATFAMWHTVDAPKVYTIDKIVRITLIVGLLPGFLIFYYIAYRFLAVGQKEVCSMYFIWVEWEFRANATSFIINVQHWYFTYIM